jgi:hypothetical protein
VSFVLWISVYPRRLLFGTRTFRVQLREMNAEHAKVVAQSNADHRAEVEKLTADHEEVIKCNVMHRIFYILSVDSDVMV